MRIILFFLFFTLQVFPQFKMTHYNSENGLPHDLCYQIIEDKQGYIWLGTDNGLVKFNGSSFQNYNRSHGLTNSFVIDVFDQDGKKYVATWGGGAYVLENGKFVPILPVKQKFSKLQQIIVNKEGDIFSVENRSKLNFIPKNKKERSKLFMLILDSGVQKLIPYDIYYKRKEFESFNFNLRLVDNQLYCFTDRFTPQFKGVSVFKNGNLDTTVFPFLKQYFVIDLKKNGNKYIAVTTESIIEFTTSGIKNIYPINLNGKSIVHYHENKFYRVFALLDKKINQHELLIVDKTNQKETSYSNKVIQSLISDITITDDNTIWVSTYGNGLLLFQKDILSLQKNVLRGNYIKDYLELKNHNFFLTLDNVFCTDKDYKLLGKETFKFGIAFKDHKQQHVFIHTKEPSNHISSLLSYKLFSKSDPNYFFWNNAKLEFGDNNLSYHIGSKRNRIKLHFTSEELITLKIKKLVPFKDKLIAISNYGVFVINKIFQLEKGFNKSNGLLGHEVINAFVKNDKLFLLQDQGLVVFDGETLVAHKYYNNSNNYFNDFVITENDNIWIASQKGLVLFKDNSFKLFTKTEGLSSSFYAKIYENAKNELIALGNNGIDIFNSEYLPELLPLKIVVSEKGKKIDEHKKIYFEPKQDNIFKVDVINFKKSKYQVQYQINDQGWKSLTGNLIDLTNYKAGEYIFKVRAKYYFSNWIYSPTFKFEKIPAWYFRWYFYLPILTVFITIVSFLVYRRFLSLKKRNVMLQNLLESNEKLQFQLNEMRHNIAQDFHDELGNKLAGITVLSEKLLHDEDNKNQQNFPIIERIYNDSQDLFQGIRDFIWAIDSKNGSLEELIFALTDFGEELFSHSGIKFIVNNHIENANFLLPNYWNRQLLLLFKEAMTNAFKHSNASHVELGFKVENNHLIITCIDNGVGFNMNELARKNGLINLQKRTQKLKSELVINSFEGTSIVFTGKLD